mgnify:FL=1
MTKSELLSQVKEYYLMSRDFNGLRICKITDYNIEDIVSLINDNLIEILSENDVINPHIKGFNLKLSKEHQIENIKDTKKLSCLYPTPKALKDAEIDNVAPYTAKLRSGEAQFQIVYFNIEILERYINNPKYLIIDYGYRGEICLKDEYWSEDQESEYVKNYGMAYKKGESIDRAVAVFLGDLAKLPQRRQLLWKSFEANNQNNYDVAEGFIKNLIYGGWVTTYWIFDAVLEEMKVINDLCSAIGIPGLFNHIYGTFYDEKPDGYSNILLPTLKNYYEFVLVIEKLIVHNISVKTFTKNASMVQAIDRKTDEGFDKGSLAMFEEWIYINVKAEFNINDKIIKPLKNIRKIRQIPAHELYDNVYDISIYEKQKKLMENIYIALKAIRHLFMGHPLAKIVEIPKYLLEEKDIVFY